MDANEVIKHASELVKGGAEIVGALKLSDLAKAFLGPATAEFAERLRDEVRIYRFGRELSCLKKAEKMAQDAGFTPKAVPIKLLFPLLEGASLEEDENLHDMWAALLANAASPENGEKVRPRFLALLKEMASDEAALMKAVAESTEPYNNFLPPMKASSKAALDGAIASHRVLQMARLLETFVMRESEKEQDKEQRFQVCLGLLEGVGLVEIGTAGVLLTPLGSALIQACRPPKTKA